MNDSLVPSIKKRFCGDTDDSLKLNFVVSGLQPLNFKLKYELDLNRNVMIQGFIQFR